MSSYMTTATRKYTPVWNALKSTGTVKLTAAKPFHKRIIRAVIKEKYMDLAYHFEMSHANRRPKLAYTVSQTVITFRLIENSVMDRL